MSVYTIADLHLSTAEGTDKSMEVFGKRWEDYVARLERAWRSLVEPTDTVVIPGDISWALSAEEALSDLSFLESLPGKKILMKGNHDFWWCTMKKNLEYCEKHALTSLSFLYNNAVACEDFIFAGTRGWYAEADLGHPQGSPDFEKVSAREAGRLRLSLDAAMKLYEQEKREIIVFTHFPPVWNEKPSGEIFSVIKEYPVRQVYYGHIHGNYTLPPHTVYEGVDLHLVSADFLSFIPQRIHKSTER